MALVIGLFLVLAGVLLAWVWLGAVVVFLKGLLAFSLVFWGALSLVVSVATLKSKRQRQAAFNDQPSDLEKKNLSND